MMASAAKARIPAAEIAEVSKVQMLNGSHGLTGSVIRIPSSARRDRSAAMRWRMWLISAGGVPGRQERPGPGS